VALLRLRSYALGGSSNAQYRYRYRANGWYYYVR
jgi:hypothetical protein